MRGRSADGQQRGTAGAAHTAQDRTARRSPQDGEGGEGGRVVGVGDGRWPVALRPVRQSTSFTHLHTCATSHTHTHARARTCPLTRTHTHAHMHTQTHKLTSSPPDLPWTMSESSAASHSTPHCRSADASACAGDAARSSCAAHRPAPHLRRPMREQCAKTAAGRPRRRAAMQPAVMDDATVHTQRAMATGGAHGAAARTARSRTRHTVQPQRRNRPVRQYSQRHTV